MATHSGHKIASDKLVFSLDASNPKCYSGSGTAVNDMSNRNHTTTLINGTGHTSSYPASKFTFDGSDDRIDVSTLTGRIDTPDGFSVETWYRGTRTARNHMWNFGNGSTVNLNCNFNDGAYALWFYWESSGSNYMLLTPSTLNSNGYGTTFTDGNNHHLVFTHTGTTNKVYYDGVDISSIFTTSGTQTMENVNATGSYNIAGSPNYGGDIFINRVYKKALTADEVTSSFRADKDRFGV